MLKHDLSNMPYVETGNAMEIWYPNVFNYLEYVYARCHETPEEKSLFTYELIERYRALGHA
jgi:hypothetical protein